MIGLAGERYALLADGRTRPVARPKRKNVRHLQAQGAVPQALAARLRAGEPLTDRDVREAMAQWQPSPAPPVQDVPIGLVV